MIDIKEKVDIKEFTTFGVSAYCNFFTEVFSLEELEEALAFAKNKKLSILFLGGGSNVLFVKDFEGIIIKLNLKGITEAEQNDEDYIIISAQAGEEWDNFVQYCIDKNYGGIENLSLIPGNVGTSPMQNIGAYGVEVKDIFHSLKALNIETQTLEIFTAEMCRFGYRESIFKNEEKNKYVILEVSFKLTKRHHKKNVSYGAISDELIKNNISEPLLSDIRKAVVNIRKSKLPDPKELGNAGSFFKNPVVSLHEFLQLQVEYPTIPHYKLPNEQVKIPAGWLVEQTGWKGKRVGDSGVHEKQALVLVNYGKAKGRDIFELSENIIADVNIRFNIQLQREVNIII